SVPLQEKRPRRRKGRALQMSYRHPEAAAKSSPYLTLSARVLGVPERGFLNANRAKADHPQSARCAPRAPPTGAHHWSSHAAARELPSLPRQGSHLVTFVSSTSTGPLVMVARPARCSRRSVE